MVFLFYLIFFTMSKKKKGEVWGENGFEDWGGYMAAKQAKLEEQFQIEANKEFQGTSNIFQGIAIFVNGYTDPTADELRRLMMAHGGIYHHYMRPSATTHVIASNLPYSKITLYRKSKNPVPICKPEWIMDSIKAVGLRDKPELKGLPVAVTHAKGNKHPASSSKEVSGSNENTVDEQGSLSEISSCSYEARKAGVKNGMFLGEALKICPNLKTIPYDFEGYKEVSYILYDTVASYTLDIEAVSCDEMYANCTFMLEESCLTPMEFAAIIRREIKQKTGCPVSTGFGSNKLLARLATRKAKPDNQYYVKQQHVETFIGTFNVQDLPGVGWTTTNKLNGINVRTCAELQAVSLTTLQKIFGRRTGEILYNMCRGIDNSKLNLEHIRKSVSAEVNYGIRFENNKDAIDFLKKLAKEVCNRLNKANARGRCITLKLLVRAKEAPKETTKFMGHGLCDYMTKSKNLISPIDNVDIITKETIALWNQMQIVPEDARGIGIQITRLEILKSKSRDMCLMSFVNKNKQSGKINKGNEAQSLLDPNSIASVSEDRTLDNQQEIHVPLNINEPILSELPKKIPNKILDSKENENLVSVANNKKQMDSTATKVNEKKSQKRIQTYQENFFKQTKSIIPVSTKVEMPPIEDVDMSVLIELPEDIRNEILNEYKTNKNQYKPNVNEIQTGSCTSSTSKPSIAELNRDEQNISFSQVDPEFLAALSEDLRRDVQMYCKAKKAECSRLKKSEVSRNNEEIRDQNIVKECKKVEHISKPKKNSKSSKITSSKNNRKKGTKTVFKSIWNKNERENALDKKNDNAVSKSIKPIVEKIESDQNQITADETEAILSHNRTVTEDNKSAVQHQDILIDLVNRLLNLSLEQAKMQIQIWITNSKIVNEVDFLSLATFLSMLPEKKRIEDLHVLLKTMHRCMTKTGNCIWHRTYRKTVKYVQHYMQIEYNSNLMVPPIKCNLLQCNNDVM
ncbi:rev1 DNA directed polymerase isoform X2 [Ptiloglossa arizonensis]|uniref:rev1 DNA directed polymerase isoform X2 n=1 Tax=Ptiloglossa arizonensis TaxID=3350558 RepID=UPI003F9ECD25